MTAEPPEPVASPEPPHDPVEPGSPAGLGSPAGPGLPVGPGSPAEPGFPVAAGSPGGFELPIQIRVAAIVVLAQGAALIVAVVVLVIEIARGGYEDAGRAWSDAAFALLGALVLGFAARGLSYLRPAFRTPVLVLEVLTLPVGYSLIQGGRWAYGVPVILSAVAVVGLLLTRPARVALERVDRR